MKWQCRWATRQDQDDLLRLFESAFGQSMPNGLWQWKYDWQEKPGILAYKPDHIIAYYGGVPRPFSLNGQTVSATQICDVMVAPGMRGILTRRGPFMHTADTYLAEQTGIDKPYRFAFGFPSQRAAELGEKSGWYARAGSFHEAGWITRKSLSLWYKTKPLASHDGALVDTLWEIMQPALPDCLIPHKHAEFFRWRYWDHPCFEYMTYLVSRRRDNKLIGLFVLRDHGADCGLELMDLLGPPKVLKILFNAALDFAKRSGRNQLSSWITADVLDHLPKPDTQKEISGIYVTPDYKQVIDQQRLSWWLMSGDTDFR